MPLQSGLYFLLNSSVKSFQILLGQGNFSLQSHSYSHNFFLSYKMCIIIVRLTFKKLAVKIGYLQSPDKRVPFSDLSIKKIEKDGHQVLLDEAFEIEASLKQFSKPASTLIDEADILVSLLPVDAALLNQFKQNQHYISFFKPYEPTYNASVLQNCKAQCYSLDMIPRSTLAQSMDALSSMASIAGYQAVLLAAAKLPRYFPMLMTAAGTIRPAKVLILGAGVAGLQAIAVARKLGAKVEVFDVRSAVKEEVESLGAKFVEVEGSQDDSAAGGYAVQQTEDYKAKQKQAIADAGLFW